jgi:hypothetical protein
MQPQASVWQPIDTAPRDGRPLVFLAIGSRQYTVGAWDRDGWDMQSAPPRTPWTHWAAVPEPPDDLPIEGEQYAAAG